MRRQWAIGGEVVADAPEGPVSPDVSVALDPWDAFRRAYQEAVVAAREGSTVTPGAQVVRAGALAGRRPRPETYEQRLERLVDDTPFRAVRGAKAVLESLRMYGCRLADHLEHRRGAGTVARTGPRPGRPRLDRSTRSSGPTSTPGRSRAASCSTSRSVVSTRRRAKPSTSATGRPTSSGPRARGTGRRSSSRGAPTTPRTTGSCSCRRRAPRSRRRTGRGSSTRSSRSSTGSSASAGLPARSRIRRRPRTGRRPASGRAGGVAAASRRRERPRRPGSTPKSPKTPITSARTTRNVRVPRTKSSRARGAVNSSRRRARWTPTPTDQARTARATTAGTPMSCGPTQARPKNPQTNAAPRPNGASPDPCAARPTPSPPRPAGARRAAATRAAMAARAATRRAIAGILRPVEQDEHQGDGRDEHRENRPADPGGREERSPLGGREEQARPRRSGGRCSRRQWKRSSSTAQTQLTPTK